VPSRVFCAKSAEAIEETRCFSLSCKRAHPSRIGVKACGKSEKLRNAPGDNPVFLQRAGRRLKTRRMRFALLRKNAPFAALGMKE
jgi:hypothetical protein